MAEQNEVAMMPPENGMKMLQLEERINGELQTYLQHHADKEEKELICRANTTLYNMAQRRGVSLWKLCFEVMPQWEASEPKIDAMQQDGNVTMNIDYDLHLVPIVIDWEHGPSYWEKKIPRPKRARGRWTIRRRGGLTHEQRRQSRTYQITLVYEN